MKTKPSASNKKRELVEARNAAQRNDFLQTAISIGNLHTSGLSPAEIITETAKIGLNISLPHVYNYIKISKIPASVQVYIRKDKINATDVLNIMHKHQTEQELLELVKQKVAEREDKELANKQKRQEEKIKKIENNIVSFFERNGIMPSKKDMGILMKITGKYTTV